MRGGLRRGERERERERAREGLGSSARSWGGGDGIFFSVYMCVFIFICMKSLCEKMDSSQELLLKGSRLRVGSDMIWKETRPPKSQRRELGPRFFPVGLSAS